MVKQFDTKFGWVIKDFSFLQSEKCYSVPVLISDCKWRLVAFPKGNKSDCLSLYLDVADFESLPCGWRRFVHIRLTIVNYFSQNLCILTEKKHCFGAKSTTCHFPPMFSLSKLHKDGGFLVNGEVMIFAELDVFNVIGTLDASEKFEEASVLLLKKISPVEESNNVNGTKQVTNSVKTSPKNKRLWSIAFLIFVFLLMGATGPKNS